MLNAAAFVSMCHIYKCGNPMDMFGILSIKPKELQHTKKYRNPAPYGRETLI